MRSAPYRLLAAFAAAIILVSCGKTAENAPAQTTQTQETAPAQETDNTEAPAEENVPAENAPEDDQPTEPFDLEGGVTDKMYSRALISEGDRTRLAAAMRKAESGEPVTLGVIGGSITQGTAASSPAKCYASLFFEWWSDRFPDCQINTVNAGIGGTNSYLGVNRADEQLLAFDPDVVIVEFSVNDTDKIMNRYSYDSLVRKILSYKSDPAVILLFTTQENGTSMQETHMKIGEAYDLPMISYREAVYPEVAAGTLSWKMISPDNIHPNDAGHSLIGQLLSRYLGGVYSELDDIPAEVKPFDMPGFTPDYYKDSKMYSPSTLEAVSSDGFETGTNTVYPDKFPENWVSDGGGSITFELDCAVFGLFYLKTTDGTGGKYEVFIDGEKKGTVDSDFSGGWGNYGETKSLLLSNEAAHHIVEIKPAEGNEDKALTILGVMAG